MLGIQCSAGNPSAELAITRTSCGSARRVSMEQPLLSSPIGLGIQRLGLKKGLVGAGSDGVWGSKSNGVYNVRPLRDVCRRVIRILLRHRWQATGHPLPLIAKAQQKAVQSLRCTSTFQKVACQIVVEVGQLFARQARRSLAEPG